MIYWITGKAGSGKSTLAYGMTEKFLENNTPVLVLDGDDVRNQFSDQNYSNFGRINHIMKISNFAAIAERQGIAVIIALVSPVKWVRLEARKLFKESIMIYIPGGTLWEGTVYEEPEESELVRPLGSFKFMK